MYRNKSIILVVKENGTIGVVVHVIVKQLWFVYDDMVDRLKVVACLTEVMTDVGEYFVGSILE